MTYDQWKTESGYAEKTPEQENEGRDCPICNGDCAGANPPVYNCPMPPPAGETIRTTQDGSMEAAPETGQSPVGAVFHPIAQCMVDAGLSHVNRQSRGSVMTIAFPAPPSTTAPLSQESRPADDWSMSYEFEDYEIQEEGISFGSFYGTAELALNDPSDRDFYVKHIAINGQKRERQTLKGYSLSVMKRTDAVLLLRMPAKDDRTFKAHLFRAIEKALYDSSDAAERFAAELED